MTQYIIRRLLQAIPLLILITILIYGLLKAVGDPLAHLANDPMVRAEDRARLRRSLGLDDPIPLQFAHWLIGDDWYQRDLDFDGEAETYGERRGVLRGDLGVSFRFGKPVVDVIGDVLPNTLILGITAYVVTVVVGLGIGIFAALRQYSFLDNIITTASFILFSMPVFLVALLAVFIFSVKFQEWGLPSLPTGGMYDVRGDRSLDELLVRLILPVFSLAAISIAGYTRFVRASMLEVINSDYIRTARAKGLSDRRVNYVHALKNASLPVITLMGLDIPFILSGAVVTETIFGWPGMGKLFIDSLTILDPPVLIIFVLMTATAVVLMQLFTDLVYAWLDPRIHYT